LLWEKHAFAMVIAAILSLLFVLLLWRVLVGSRPRVILQPAATVAPKTRGGR